MKDEPNYGAASFRCPHCAVVAFQIWFNKNKLTETVEIVLQDVYLDTRVHMADYEQKIIADFLNDSLQEFAKRMTILPPESLSVATCVNCRKYSLWVAEEMVYPRKVPVEPPNEDLDEGIKEIYKEAAAILPESPRGAAALLRLCLQMLLKQVGKDGKNINSDIEELVKEGLDPTIQKALDLLRVVGNNAVHPGQISFEDNKDVALELFSILNLIAKQMITIKKEVDALYNRVIPEETKKQIENRNRRNN